MNTTKRPDFTIPLKLIVAILAVIPLISGIAGSPQFTFNDGRLAPAFSILSGNPPYFPLNSGPVLNSVYGPLSYFYYFPCALFRWNVSLVLLCGAALSLAAFMAPVGIILWRERRNFDLASLTWLGALAVLQVVAYASLTYSAFNIHADAPAVFLSCMSVLVLDRREGDAISPRMLFLSATLAAATIWVKQTYAPVVFLPLIAALAEKQTWRVRIGLAVWIGFLTFLFFGLFAWWCGKEAVLDNFLKVAAGVPSVQASFLYGSDPNASGGTLRSVVIAMHIIVGKYLAPYLLCLPLALLLTLKKGGESARNWSLRISRLSWLFFLLALLNLPMSASAAVKLGASVNSDTPFAWFFIFGLFCLVLDSVRPGAPGKFPAGNRAVCLVFTAVSLLSCAGVARHIGTHLKTISQAFNNDDATVVQICRRSPSKYYFPWNPLAVYLGEGRFYNYEYMAEVRSSSLMPPTVAHFSRFVPPNASVLALPKGLSSETNYLANYFDSLTPCANPEGVAGQSFAWFNFQKKP